MRITQTLFRHTRRLPKGHIWRGKERLYKEVTPLIAAKARANFELEEQNMFYLRHPYLTIEQQAGQGYLFNHAEKFMEKNKKARAQNIWPHRLLSDKFGFLKIGDKWE